MEINVKYPNSAEILHGFGGEVLGDHYAAYDMYLTKNGNPFILKMGEIHYSRTDEREWEEEIIKIRNGGIDVIASYVFWIHHEEIEGVYDFNGNRNIADFLKICRKLNMPFVLRIGPWVHGEARNGGFPDWLSEKTNGELRTLAEPYMTYVRRFFERLYKEVSEYSDVIFGIQIENELRGEVAYARELKKMLIDIGYTAPFWTFTGWGGADKPESCPYGEVLCLYGAYPEAPWLGHVNVHNECTSFLFTSEREDSNIGNDIFNNGINTPEKIDYNTPFLTCEMGGGNQITYHRRPLISKEDILSIVLCKLGSGSNGIGYYVYRGGKNPIGLTTMQESRQSGYSNDLPIVSYDFQAPIGEAGQLRESYFYIKPLHDFISLEGKKLAKMPAYFPETFPNSCTDTKTLRCAVRSDGRKGYIFVNNHFHAGEMLAVCEKLAVNLPEGEKITLDLELAPHASGIIPFNYEIGNETVNWLTALPVGEDDDKITLCVQAGIDPFICLDGKISEIVNGMIVGDKKIELVKYEAYKKSEGKELEIEMIGESEDDTFFSHIVNYDGTVPDFGSVIEYKFKIPEGAKYLNINAEGNIGALYFDDKLYSDFYLCGDTWTVSVKFLPKNSELTLKILTLCESDKEKIYFEHDMKTGVVLPVVSAIFDEIIYV